LIAEPERMSGAGRLVLRGKLVAAAEADALRAWAAN
jgi:hypothetical protein